jgi:hypothetical protein
MFKNKISIILLFFSYHIISCNVKNQDFSFDKLESKHYSLIADNSANSEFTKETSSEISVTDYLNRQRYCPLSKLNEQEEINDIIYSYNNINLLDTSTSKDIPAMLIQNKTRELTSAKLNFSNNLGYCYYPELFLANAYALNILQRVPFVPFNHEVLLMNQSKIDPSEVKNWNTNEIIKNSRFAKLNGIIRSANIAEKISAMDETRLSIIPRFYANKENNKVYLFGFQEQLTKENYYKHINSLANALSAIGYFERAMYRWKGVYTAEELNMYSSLPNDSLQEVYLEALETLGNEYNHNESSVIKLSVKNIIAYDFIKAHEKSRSALANKFCSSNSDFDKILTHDLNLCSEVKKIQDRAFNFDIKNMFCTSGKKFEQPKNPDEVIFNLIWDEVECEKLLNETPELENSYLDSKGYSYYDIYPANLNSIKFTEDIKNTKENIERVRSKIRMFNFAIDQVYQNRDFELYDSKYNMLLINKISPKITSFADGKWRIDHVNDLAKQIVKIATIKIMHIPSDKRNLIFDENRFNKLVTLVSNVKYYCSYLSSFDDAQYCLNEIVGLNEEISLKNDIKQAKFTKNFVVKILSKDLRNYQKSFVSPEEQRNNDELLEELNATGVVDINLTEDYFKLKNSILGEFSEDYYKAKIIGISSVIYKNGSYMSEFVSRPFDNWDNVAYLLHEGFQDHTSITGCSAKYESYASRLYLNYISEITNSNFSYEYEKLGKYYPKLFSVNTLLSYMCNRAKNTNSSKSSKEKLSNNIISPIPILSSHSANAKVFKNKFSSMDWIEELQNDPSARPSESDGYWQPLTGFIADLQNRKIDSEKYITQIQSCINLMNFDTESCVIPKKAIYNSFSGFPLLGHYKFVYAMHALDLYESSFNEDSSEGSFIDGIELNFIISY